ncbi:Ethanolamine-phosphate cytidylyltransferase [Phytophthora megakarya]|uniref:Ethanolamine-phosphate cytidylyltransferase n=1 Tax=Phytophthora megakarya TaxID=4795 RepID=A0A225WVL7_9STRA|nr:Ethanolamine-phosphate cytidylyltransferase [Phytophthora megakarya]
MEATCALSMFATNNHLLSRMQQGNVKYCRPKFLMTNRMLRLFSVDSHKPLLSNGIVYTDRGFDMFHANHMDILHFDN